MSAGATAHVFRYSPYSGVTFAVHLAVADSVNDQHGNRFWLSVNKLSTKARYQRRAVQMALRTLVTDGWLEQLQGAEGETRQYRFVYDESHPVVYEDRWTGGAKSAPPTAAPAQNAAPGGANNSFAPVHSMRPNPSNTTQEQPNTFADFWAAYPLHKAKDAAERAFAKALKRADVATIVAGAERYASEVKEHEILIAYPASWLNAGRWTDEPLPARPVNGQPVHVSIPASQRRADEERTRRERRELVERLAGEGARRG